MTPEVRGGGVRRRAKQAAERAREKLRGGGAKENTQRRVAERAERAAGVAAPVNASLDPSDGDGMSQVQRMANGTSDQGGGRRRPEPRQTPDRGRADTGSRGATGGGRTRKSGEDPAHIREAKRFARENNLSREQTRKLVEATDRAVRESDAKPEEVRIEKTEDGKVRIRRQRGRRRPRATRGARGRGDRDTPRPRRRTRDRDQPQDEGGVATTAPADETPPATGASGGTITVTSGAVAPILSSDSGRPQDSEVVAGREERFLDRAFGSFDNRVRARFNEATAGLPTGADVEQGLDELFGGVDDAAREGLDDIRDRILNADPETVGTALAAGTLASPAPGDEVVGVPLGGVLIAGGTLAAAGATTFGDELDVPEDSLTDESEIATPDDPTPSRSEIEVPVSGTVVEETDVPVSDTFVDEIEPPADTAERQPPDVLRVSGQQAVIGEELEDDAADEEELGPPDDPFLESDRRLFDPRRTFGEQEDPSTFTDETDPSGVAQEDIGEGIAGEGDPEVAGERAESFFENFQQQIEESEVAAEREFPTGEDAVVGEKTARVEEAQTPSVTESGQTAGVEAETAVGDDLLGGLLGRQEAGQAPAIGPDEATFSGLIDAQRFGQPPQFGDFAEGLLTTPRTGPASTTPTFPGEGITTAPPTATETPPDVTTGTPTLQRFRRPRPRVPGEGPPGPPTGGDPPPRPPLLLGGGVSGAGLEAEPPPEADDPSDGEILPGFFAETAEAAAFTAAEPEPDGDSEAFEAAVSGDGFAALTGEFPSETTVFGTEQQAEQVAATTALLSFGTRGGGSS